MPPSKPPKDPVDRFRRALDKGGLSGVSTAIGRVQKQAEAAQKPFEKLASALDDPRLRSAAGQALAVEDATRKLNSQARERLAIEARRQAVITGGYGRELRANQLINKERERVEAMERRARYDARFGALVGGIADRADRFRQSTAYRIGAATATGVGTAVAGAAMSGFSGTVEGNRLNLEMKLVSRELAGAFKPAIELVTKALRGLRERLEKLTPRQQNLLMLGGLGFGGLAAAGLARFGLGGAMGVARASLTGLGVLGGAAASAGGAAAGSAAGTAAGAAAAGAGAGAAARASLLSRAAPFAARAGGAAYAGYQAFDQIQDIRSDPSTLRGIGRQSVRGFDFFAGGELARLAGYQSGGPLGQAYDAVFGANPTRTQAASPEQSQAQQAERRKVMIADAGFETAGSARDRFTTALAMVDAGDANKTPTTLLEDIKSFLVETFGGGSPPPLR